MSREVRRVPVDWQHPVEHNPHWEFQVSTPFGRQRPPSRLHGPTEQHVSLNGDYAGAVTRHVEELGQISRREGHEWTWPLGYHLQGYDGHDGVHHDPVPFCTYDAEGEPSAEVTPADEDELQALLIQEKADEAPDPEDYMPVFDVPEDELGWCLYQTVSEGTPVTPVFATAAELVEHLVQAGEDGDQTPYRRQAAERLVSSGHSWGSFVHLGGGELLDGARDGDRIQEAMDRG